MVIMIYVVLIPFDIYSSHYTVSVLYLLLRVHLCMVVRNKTHIRTKNKTCSSEYI